MSEYDTIDRREDVDRAFETLKAATPEAFQQEFRRMMLMGRRGNVHDFKHADMRRGFGFDVVTGEFSLRGNPGHADEVVQAEAAYQWAVS